LHNLHDNKYNKIYQQTFTNMAYYGLAVFYDNKIYRHTVTDMAVCVTAQWNTGIPTCKINCNKVFPLKLQFKLAFNRLYVWIIWREFHKETDISTCN
jgi:hypothetical protein